MNMPSPPPLPPFPPIPKRRTLLLALGALVLFLIVGQVIAGGGTGGGARQPASYCGNLVEFQGTIGELQAGTIITAEAVERLDSHADSFRDNALLWPEGNASGARALETIADATDRLKVALASGGGVSRALGDLADAVQAVPACT